MEEGVCRRVSWRDLLRVLRAARRGAHKAAGSDRRVRTPPLLGRDQLPPPHPCRGGRGGVVQRLCASDAHSAALLVLLLPPVRLDEAAHLDLASNRPHRPERARRRLHSGGHDCERAHQPFVGDPHAAADAGHPRRAQRRALHVRRHARHLGARGPPRLLQRAGCEHAGAEPHRRAVPRVRVDQAHAARVHGRAAPPPVPSWLASRARVRALGCRRRAPRPVDHSVRVRALEAARVHAHLPARTRAREAARPGRASRHGREGALPWHCRRGGANGAPRGRARAVAGLLGQPRTHSAAVDAHVWHLRVDGMAAIGPPQCGPLASVTESEAHITAIDTTMTDKYIVNHRLATRSPPVTLTSAPRSNNII
mmetsp:Transcript_4401/g.11402  ORF Transcript_4401/g.11402 Transcript_4401/m.11402 type:complete len:367 (-) Transcript_4401:4-1104(-)